MFPPLTVHNTSVSSIRRVLLCNRIRIPSSVKDLPLEVIDLRHYSISTRPVGLPRSVRKTSVSTAALPNLSKLDDVADFVLNGNGYESMSEVDEDEKVDIHIPSIKQENPRIQQRAIKLCEIGPRLRLELVKIEEGMCDGKVLYHSYVTKTKGEEKELEERHKAKAEEKARRRKEQEENVARRKAEKEAQAEVQRQRLSKSQDHAMEIDEDEQDDEERLLALEDELDDR